MSKKRESTVKSGAVNLKKGPAPMNNIPTSDFDELNRLIDGDNSQTGYDTGINFNQKKPVPQMTPASPTKQNFRVF
jgi:hypothetical protein